MFDPESGVWSCARCPYPVTDGCAWVGLVDFNASVEDVEADWVLHFNTTHQRTETVKAWRGLGGPRVLG